jgi:uncharacterized protein YegL
MELILQYNDIVKILFTEELSDYYFFYGSAHSRPIMGLEDGKMVDCFYLFAFSRRQSSYTYPFARLAIDPTALDGKRLVYYLTSKEKPFPTGKEGDLFPLDARHTNEELKELIGDYEKLYPRVREFAFRDNLSGEQRETLGKFYRTFGEINDDIQKVFYKDISPEFFAWAEGVMQEHAVECPNSDGAGVDSASVAIKVENPGEPHLDCVILLDTSGAMAGGAIHKLNEALRYFAARLKDTVSERSVFVDVALVSFGPDVTIASPFTSAENLAPPTLWADGPAQMGAAILRAMEMLEERKELYKEFCISYGKPWIFCVIDGSPNDDCGLAASRLREWEAGGRGIAFCAALKDSDFATLTEIFDKKRVFELSDSDFAAVLRFLCDSFAKYRPEGKFLVDLPDNMKPCGFP